MELKLQKTWFICSGKDERNTMMCRVEGGFINQNPRLFRVVKHLRKQFVNKKVGNINQIF